MDSLSLTGKSVLIIDDMAQMRSLLTGIITEYKPKKFTYATNGKDAIEMIKKNKFDVVLCDYNLGEGQDGQQVLEEVKCQNLIPYYTVFIMVTAETTIQMVMGAAEYVPDDYISKPINKHVLASRLKKLLDKKQVLHALSDALDKDSPQQIIQCCDDILEKNKEYKAELLKLKCEQLLKLEKYDEALEIAEGVLKEHDIPWAMMVVGQVHFFNKRYSDAENIFREIIEIDKAFMPAYDWLAKALDLTGCQSDAQEVLMNAVEISPKSLLRQRSLAKLADINNDEEQLEKACKKAVDIARDSCLKKASDYTKLAKVYLHNKAPHRALKLLNETTQAFKDDEKALAESTVESALVYKAMGDKVKYKSAVDKALKLSSNKKSLIQGEVAVDLARSCADLGKTEEAQELLESVAKANFEDEKLMGEINDICEKSNIETKGEELIDKAKSEFIKLNNKGVALIKEGEVAEAIKLFQIAVREMPENPTININVAKSLLLNMQENGVNPRVQNQVYTHLNVVLENDPYNEKAIALQAKCKNLSA